MVNFFKAQLFALILLSVLLIIVILRTPGESIEVIKVYRNINDYHLANIRKDLNVSFVSTSNDPYIILPPVIINNPYKSFLHINVDYSANLCGANLKEPASFIQVFWRSIKEDFSEDKSDAAPISLGRSNYLIPLHSLSRLLEISANSVKLEFRIDIVNKVECKFRINKIILGTF